jgi:hypothetical protein
MPLVWMSDEVRAVLNLLEGVSRLMASALGGSGLPESLAGQSSKWLDW